MSMPRLRIPAALAVTWLGCGPAVEPSPGTTTDETTTTDAPPPTTTAPPTTTTSSTTTGTDDTSTSGPFVPPDCATHSYVAECEDEDGCVWRPDVGGCVLECAEIPDFDRCIAQPHCVWTDECGDPGPI